VAAREHQPEPVVGDHAAARPGTTAALLGLARVAGLDQ
jgi:hypothetical protein